MLESQLEELGVLGSFLPPDHYGVPPEWMSGEVAMARFEALITPVADGQALHAALEQIAQSWGAALTWLDRRNASMDLVSGGLPVKLLLELRRGDVLGVLVSSREGMGAGAPQSKKLLDQLLRELLEHVPRAQVQFRSDRDGPIFQGV